MLTIKENCEKTNKKENVNTSYVFKTEGENYLRQSLEKAITPQANDDEEIIEVADMLEGVKHKQAFATSDIKMLANTIRQTLLEIAEIKECNNERRHKELMQLLDKHLGKRAGRENKELQELIQNDKNDDIVVADAKEKFKELSDEVSFDSINDEMVQEEVNLEPTDTTIMLNSALECVRSKLKSKTVFTNIKRLNASQNEFHIMRAKMLEEQRKKMEDRESKKRKLI